MKQKTIIKILVLFLVILLTIPLVSAIGIRPAKTEMVFEDSKDLTKQFWVVNNEEREFTMKVFVEGEMAQYVTLKTTELRFKEDDDAKAIEFEVHLPEEVPPGQSTANIIVEETTDSSGANVVSSKLVLKHKLIIQGAYPDKFINAKLNFHDVGDSFELVTEVENLGKQDINKVQTKFYVNDKEQKQQELETETTSLKTKENKLLRTKLQKNVLAERGEFEVLAVTTYDDQKVELVKKLLVGRPEVEVTYFDKYFIAKKINQYSMDLLNKWNQKVENVFVDVEIKKDGEKIDGFRTKTVEIEGDMIKKIKDYFDANNKETGKYTFDLVVNFWNSIKMESRTQTFESEFLTEEEFSDLETSSATALSGRAVESSSNSSAESFPFKTGFWLLLGILIGALGFFILWRYSHRDRYEGGDEAF